MDKARGGWFPAGLMLDPLFRGPEDIRERHLNDQHATWRRAPQPPSP